MTIDLDDYESLPDSLPFVNHMIAGAMAGMVEHGVMYPLDTIKTRMQILSTSSKPSISSAMGTIIRDDGYRGLWKGLGSLLMGSGPAHAIYFATYEQSKDILLNGSTDGMRFFLSTAASGGIATICSDAFMTPFDVLKQRMQLGIPTTSSCATGMTTTAAQKGPDCLTPAANCPTESKRVRFSSFFHCLRYTVEREGLRSLYISYPTTITLSIPFQSIQFASYEQYKILLGSINSSYFEGYSPLSHAIAGALAGATASILTNPLDVAKTLLQTKGLSTCPIIQKSTSMSQAFRIIHKREGIRGFYRGTAARVFGVMPSTGLSWLVYEYCKWIWNDKHSSSSGYGDRKDNTSLSKEQAAIKKSTDSDRWSREGKETLLEQQQ